MYPNLNLSIQSFKFHVWIQSPADFSADVLYLRTTHAMNCEVSCMFAVLWLPFASKASHKEFCFHSLSASPLKSKRTSEQKHWHSKQKGKQRVVFGHLRANQTNRVVPSPLCCASYPSNPPAADSIPIWGCFGAWRHLLNPLPPIWTRCHSAIPPKGLSVKLHYLQSNIWIWEGDATTRISSIFTALVCNRIQPCRTRFKRWCKFMCGVGFLLWC